MGNRRWPSWLASEASWRPGLTKIEVSPFVSPEEEAGRHADGYWWASPSDNEDGTLTESSNRNVAPRQYSHHHASVARPMPFGCPAALQTRCSSEQEARSGGRAFPRLRELELCGSIDPARFFDRR